MIFPTHGPVTGDSCPAPTMFRTAATERRRKSTASSRLRGSGLRDSASVSAAPARRRHRRARGGGPSRETAAVEVFWAMPWKASTSRPMGRIHTSVAASAPETPIAFVANRAAVVLSSQHYAMTNAIIAAVP
jgi:hypothetical protein